jgi:hypothetical protein
MLLLQASSNLIPGFVHNILSAGIRISPFGLFKHLQESSSELESCIKLLQRRSM